MVRDFEHVHERGQRAFLEHGPLGRALDVARQQQAGPGRPHQDDQRVVVGAERPVPRRVGRARPEHIDPRAADGEAPVGVWTKDLHPRAALPQDREQVAVFRAGGSLTVAPERQHRQLADHRQQAVLVVWVRMAKHHHVDLAHIQGPQRREQRPATDATVVTDLTAAVDQHRRAVVEAQQGRVAVADVEHPDIDAPRLGARRGPHRRQQAERQAEGANSPGDEPAAAACHLYRWDGWAGQRRRPQTGGEREAHQRHQCRRWPQPRPGLHGHAGDRVQRQRAETQRPSERLECSVGAGVDRQRGEPDGQQRDRQQPQRHQRYDHEVGERRGHRQRAEHRQPWRRGADERAK